MDNRETAYLQLFDASGNIAEETLLAEYKNLDNASIFITTRLWGKLLSSRHTLMNMVPSSKLDAMGTGYVGCINNLQIFVPAMCDPKLAIEQNKILRNRLVLEELTSAYYADL